MSINTIKLIEKSSGVTLFECDLEQSELAYAQAKQYEEIGLDIEWDAPSSPQTLLSALGARPEMMEGLKKEVNAELEDHDSCCFDPEAT
jgi:hypothetical protein